MSASERVLAALHEGKLIFCDEDLCAVHTSKGSFHTSRPVLRTLAKLADGQRHTVHFLLPLGPWAHHDNMRAALSRVIPELERIGIDLCQAKGGSALFLRPA